MIEYIKKYRFSRRSSNQLMMLWLRRDIARLGRVNVALDAGCGRFINRNLFKTDRYVGLDTTPESIMAGRRIHPDAVGYVGSVLETLPEKADLVVCTLVLNNKRFPHVRTIEAVNNLVAAVRPGGNLLFTMGQVNAPYECSVDKILSDNFATIGKRVYGRFNYPSYFSYPLAWLMDALPSLREAKGNRMLYYHASGRR